MLDKTNWTSLNFLLPLDLYSNLPFRKAFPKQRRFHGRVTQSNIPRDRSTLPVSFHAHPYSELCNSCTWHAAVDRMTVHDVAQQ